MRRRTPSEIKAYGDGYAEAYKEFCHLLKNHDVDKAIRKMEIFANAVALTVETAIDEPSNSEKPNNCKDWQDWKDRMWAEAIVTEPTISKMEQVDKDINVRSKDEPQTDCPWK